MKVQRTHIRVAAAAASLILLAGCGSQAAAVSNKAGPARSVTATATGSTTGVPDQLTAQVGISNEGSSAAAVLAENNAKTQSLLNELKIAGIDDKDVQTTSVDLGPRFNDKGRITGYQANNMLRVTLRNLSTAGTRLDALVKAGGDNARIQGISLGFTDDDALLSKARVDAIKRAKAQAKEMAEAAGAKLGKVRTIADVAGFNPVFEEYGARDQALAVSSVPISAGSEDLTVRVKVVFELTS